MRSLSFGERRVGQLGVAHVPQVPAGLMGGNPSIVSGERSEDSYRLHLSIVF